MILLGPTAGFAESARACHLPGLSERVICRACRTVSSDRYTCTDLSDLDSRQTNRQTDPFHIYIPKQLVFAGSGRPFYLPGLPTASFAGSIWQCNNDYMNALKCQTDRQMNIGTDEIFDRYTDPTKKFTDLSHITRTYMYCRFCRIC